MPDHLSYSLMTDIVSSFCPQPTTILQRRMVKKGNKVVAQTLVQWERLPAHCATLKFTTALQIRFPHFYVGGKGSFLL